MIDIAGCGGRGFHGSTVSFVPFVSFVVKAFSLLNVS